MDKKGSFWTFSLEFYADPSVAGICVDLQDRHSSDVNILLFVLWCASRHRRLSPHELGRVVASVSGWQNEVVRPLRGVRRNLKQFALDLALESIVDLREAVKKQELEAERLQQSLMEAKFGEIGSPASDRAATASSNVELYATLVGQVFPTAYVIALVARLQAIRPN
ncbi:TIGR02444 family protein [Bradyrhizobium canariense]|uniref:TIGR02444 family protein n=1 Tax=Bradyrhizobium canariense TaxID=255045 RepID=A0A1H1XNB2_9BRAD|nr:TIGR02444 family protein [Bradyrhizobium canariense]SDT10319.1 TIGR02444 family protein [Bradyrhizobium canariense]